MRRQAAHWLVLLAAGLVILSNQRYFDLVAFGFTRRGLADNLLTQIGGVSYLVLRLIGLHGYNIDPALPTLTSFDGVLALQAGLLMALLALGIVSLKTRPWVGFGILWFFLQLAPTNSVVPRLDVANDRQLYLACWGIFIALAVQITRLGLPIAVLRPATAVMALAFATSSVVRQLDYVDEVTLWETDVRGAPWNARARNNLGFAYYLAGREEDARREIETALFFDPRNAKAQANLRVLNYR